MKLYENGSFCPVESFFTVRSKLPHHVAAWSQGHQCTGLSTRLRSQRKFPVEVSRLRSQQRSHNGPKPGYLARQTKRYPGRRKRCLQTVALSTGTFCLQYVQYVLCILQWFAGLLYIFPLHSNEMLLCDFVSSMQQQPTAK